MRIFRTDKDLVIQLINDMCGVIKIMMKKAYFHKKAYGPCMVWKKKD